MAEYNTVKAGIRCTARKTVTNSSAPEQMLGAVLLTITGVRYFKMTETQVAKLVWGILSIVMLGIYTFEGIPILLIPALWGLITLSIAWLLYRRDKKKASKRPPLPCEGHKGTWSNPKYFTEKELQDKD